MNHQQCHLMTTLQWEAVVLSVEVMTMETTTIHMMMLHLNLAHAVATMSRPTMQ
jgi:hypothetical protein